ncbi:hypothetical protein ACLMMR_42075, partial [Streptomyces sp. NPDC000405]
PAARVHGTARTPCVQSWCCWRGLVAAKTGRGAAGASDMAEGRGTADGEGSGSAGAWDTAGKAVGRGTADADGRPAGRETADGAGVQRPWGAVRRMRPAC